MAVTIISTLMLMAGYFLQLFGAVGFIQDKRFFTSAPKEYQALIEDREERFKGAHVVGWIIVLLALILFAGAFVLAIRDGAGNGFTPLKYFARFIAMLYLLELYDILFFDWFLLCRSDFYLHYYPELKTVDRSRFFGFNRKSHILHFILYIPASAALACGALF